MHVNLVCELHIWATVDHTQKRRFRFGATYRTIKALAILRCLHGSEMVLLWVVVRKSKTPTINISQEKGHGMLMIKYQFVVYNYR